LSLEVHVYALSAPDFNHIVSFHGKAKKVLRVVSYMRRNYCMCRAISKAIIHGIHRIQILKRKCLVNFVRNYTFGSADAVTTVTTASHAGFDGSMMMTVCSAEPTDIGAREPN